MPELGFLRDIVILLAMTLAAAWLFSRLRLSPIIGYLATGEYTLVESYWKTTLFTSWMMVLVGDPLYKPFAKAPKFKLDKVKASPSGWKLGLRQ